MRRAVRWSTGVLLILLLIPVTVAATEPAVRRVSGRRVTDAFPYTVVSSDRMLADLEQLTAIRAHQGWRCCGSQGEAQARDVIEAWLGELGFLNDLGMEVERTDFRTVAGMEMWETRLELVVDGEVREVPADAPTGSPYRIESARAFDSDGGLADWDRDPVVAEGDVVVVRTVDDLSSLVSTDVADKVVVLDFSLVDWMIVPTADAFSRIATLMSYRPVGLVAVTRGSNTVGESHGTFIGDAGILNYAQIDPPVPILFARLEDMGPAGVRRWGDLERIESARLTWDTDIVTPGESANVVARIPGVSPDHAVILSAHLDSPNTPGALDNGSGSVSLLEVARVLNAARIQPETDLYLVWYGCHERGIHGSAHFAASHQEVLDRALAVIELDALARPLDGISGAINLETRSYAEFGDDRLPLPSFLKSEVDRLGLEVSTWDFHGLLSDVTGFVGYDVPNALLDNLSFPEMEAFPALHYPAHWHDPYETVELARDVAGVLEDLTRVMLATVLEAGRELPDLRVTPERSRRAVMVGSHTEPEAMSPYAMTEFGMTMAWSGFDVDLVPYGQRLTDADLEGADLVIALPVLDYPNEYGDPDVYDERWRAGEITVLESYVEGGGRLVLTNSGYRLWFNNSRWEFNEDWVDANALAERLGVSYVDGPMDGELALTVGEHPLIDGVDTLWLAIDNALPFDAPPSAEVIATLGGRPVAAVVGFGAGEALVLSDLGLLGDGSQEADNRRFWENLAEWARSDP